jgi:hypothetical protein
VSNETITAVSVHDTNDEPVERELAPLEIAPLRRLVCGDASQALEFAQALAADLRGPEGDDARRTMLSSALASERAVMAVLHVLLADRIRKGDVRAASAIGAALDACTRRVERLAGAHRAENRGTGTNVVMVSAAQVKIGGG